MSGKMGEWGQGFLSAGPLAATEVVAGSGLGAEQAIWVQVGFE